MQTVLLKVQKDTLHLSMVNVSGNPSGISFSIPITTEVDLAEGESFNFYVEDINELAKVVDLLA
jgi:hypothetical protein